MMNKFVNKSEEGGRSNTKNINQEKMFVAHILNIIAFIIPIVLVIAIYNLPFENNRKDNGGVDITMQAEIPFKSFITIIVIGICIFILGMYLYFTKANKIKHILSYIYLFAAIIDLIWLFITTCLYIIATCGLGAVMFIPGILQIKAGINFVTATKVQNGA